MKALLPVFLLIALLAMTTEGVRGNTGAMRECPAPPRGCCDQRDHAPPAAPVNSSCQQCCLPCCAILPGSVIRIQVPASDPASYLRIDFGGVSRNEPPPVPPPRVS